MFAPFVWLSLTGPPVAIDNVYATERIFERNMKNTESEVSYSDGFQVENANEVLVPLVQHGAIPVSFGEIGRRGRSKKQNENMVKSRKVEDGIGNVRRTRGIWMTESRNVGADGENLRLVDVARGMSAEDAVRSRDIKYRIRQRR
jgi:hypothetical protein